MIEGSVAGWTQSPKSARRAKLKRSLRSLPTILTVQDLEPFLDLLLFLSEVLQFSPEREVGVLQP